MAAGALAVVIGAVVAAVVTATTGGGHRRLAAIEVKVETGLQGGRATGVQLGPPTGHPGDARVPILMYHVINAPPPGAPFPGLYVPRGEFAAQMSALARAGWHAVTLDQVRENWLHGNRLPAKPIVLTFDNGYRSQYTNALPILRSHGWAADENIQITRPSPSIGGISDAQVRGLVRAGWELDTQGMQHVDLVGLDATELRDQIDSARSLLRRRFHVAVNWFCYPSGQYDPAVAAAVRAGGYAGSTTVVPGWAGRGDDAFELPRLRVLGGTSPAGLLAQIAAARGAGAPPPAYESSS